MRRSLCFGPAVVLALASWASIPVAARAPRDEVGVLPLVAYQIGFVQISPVATPATLAPTGAGGAAGPPQWEWLLPPQAPGLPLFVPWDPSSGQILDVRVAGRESAAGLVVGSLGSPIRIRLQSLPAAQTVAFASPDLRHTSFSLELLPRSLDAGGRVETLVHLEVSGTAGQGQYRHSLWVGGGSSAVLALLRDRSGKASYALVLNAGPAAPPAAEQAQLNVAALAPFEEAYFALLDAQPARREAPLTGGAHARLELSSEPLLALKAGASLPFAAGRASAEGQLGWPGATDGIDATVRLRVRLIHELDLVAQHRAHLGADPSAERMVGLGLAEQTHPARGVTLTATFLPVVFRSALPDSAWVQETAAWEAGARWEAGPWVFAASAASGGLLERLPPSDIELGAEAARRLGRGFEVAAGAAGGWLGGTSRVFLALRWSSAM